MEDYMKKGIKALIALHPVIGTILKANSIDCAGCSVGICALEDVVKLHRLPEGQEKEMMDRISMIFTDGADNPSIDEMPGSEVETRILTYSDPMKRLVDEHMLIKRWLELIPEVIKGLDLESDEGLTLIHNGIDMIRSYADRYHHAKEEEILFAYFDENSDILKVMKLDHAAARSHVAAMVKAVEEKNADVVKSHLVEYKKLLEGHIQKEDEILFPWMDSELNESQLEEIAVKFDKVDKTIGFPPEKYERFIDQLEKDIKR